MTDTTKQWAGTASSPIADIEAERERIRRKFDELDPAPFRPDPNNPFTRAFAEIEQTRTERSLAARFTPGCPCGCRDGRRVR